MHVIRRSLLALVALLLAAGGPGDESVAERLARVREYHGAAGPWAVVGYRIGERSLKELGLPRYSHSLRVVHRCPAMVQYSCMADGLQAATGASAGKLNLRVEEVAAEALSTVVEDRSSGRRLTFTLRPEFVRTIKDLPSGLLDEAGRRVAALPDEDIFRIAESRPANAR